MKILVATEKAFAPIAIFQIREIAEAAGHTLSLLENYSGTSDLISALADAEAVIVRSDKITAEIIEAASKLRIIVRAGAGYDNIDLKACSARNIVVMNTPGQNSNAVAELVFELMLYQIRGGFSGKSGFELRGKTIGIHAFGNVGKYVSDIARGFGMDTYAYDPFVSERIMKNNNAKQVVNLEILYSKCQFITIHLPYNDITKESVGYELLKRMPPNAVLVNTARKEVINEKDLLRIFEERKDFSYLADIEPDCKAVFEEKYKGRYVFTSKKMGAQTEESNINSAVAAARQIVNFFKTGNEKYRVNL
jgi:D-3-phosphoglycerate dehydrogenase / 2-oxoglutarate reductase